MASSTVAMGDELEIIQTELLGFKSLAGDAKVQLISAWFDLPSSTASLLTIAPRKCLVAGAGPDAIIIVRTDTVRKAFESPSNDDSEARPVEPLVKIPVSAPISHLAFTSDEQYLLVASQHSSSVAVYETASLLGGGLSSAFELSISDVAVRILCPNVATEKAELCAVVTENGALHMLNLKSRSISSALVSEVSCVAWSTKGKQLVAGKVNGTVQQMTPDGDIKAEIPCPDGFHGVHVSSIQWLENHLFVAIYMTINENPPTSTYYVITRQPPSSYSFRKLPDPVDPFGSEKAPHHSILRLKDFPPNLQNVLVVSSTESPDIGLLTRSKTPLSTDFESDSITGVFTMTEMLDDTRRAGLPMDANCNNSIPIGMALDLSARDTVYKPIPSEEIDESPGPVPAVWVLTNEGVLVGWWLIYNESIKEGTTYPNMAALLPDLEEPASLQPATPATPATPAPPALAAPAALSSTPSAFGAPSAFGNASTTSAFGNASALGSKASPWGASDTASASPSTASKFGTSGFGNTPAPSASPAFGQPSSMGAGQSVISAKPLQWGSSSNAASSAPAFGQSGFASYGGTKSAFGAPSASTSSPLGSSAKSGGFSSFASTGGGFSSFGGAGGSSGESIFGKTSGTAPSPFTSTSNTDTAFKSTGSSGFGSSQPFKLQSSFQPQKTDDDEDATPDTKQSQSGSLFSTGFGAALDTSNSQSKDQDMDAAETTPAKTPSKSIFSAAAAITTPEVKGHFGTASGSFGSTKIPSQPIFGQPSSVNTQTPPRAEPSAISQSVFGSSSTPNATPRTAQESTTPATATKPIFGQSSSGFGQTSTTPSQTKSIFGTPKPEQESTTPATTGKSIFGQPSSGFGQPSATPNHKKSIFGDPKSAQEPSTPTAPASIFGQPSRGFGQPSSTPSQTKSIFGNPSPSQESTTPMKSGSVFGQPSKIPIPGATRTSIFGTPSSSTPPAQSATNVFAKSIDKSKTIFGSPTALGDNGKADDEARKKDSSDSDQNGEEEFEEEEDQEEEHHEDGESEEEPFDEEDSNSEESTTPASKEKSFKPTLSSFKASGSSQKGASSIFDSTTPAKTTMFFGKATTPPTKSKIFGQTGESSTPAGKSTSTTLAKNPFAASTTPTTTPAPSRFSFMSSTSAPVPPESTSKKSYTAGDSSSSSASKKGVSDDDSTFLKPSLPKSTAKSTEKSTSVLEDAPLPPDPRLLTKKPTGRVGGIGKKSNFRKPPPPESEDESEEQESDDEEVSGPHDGNDLESDLEFDGSVVHVSKEISPSSSGRTHSSFSGLNGPFTLVSKPSTSDKTSLFSESLSKPSAIFPPPTQTSPRSPSPMRTAVPPRMMRAEGTRSVSAPGLPSNIAGRGTTSKAFGSSILGSKDSQIEENSFLSQQRKAKAKKDADEAQPLVDDEDDEVQKLLASELQPTLEIDQLMAHTDVAPPAHDSIPAQVEAVYRDINSMVDTIGLNARSVMQFVLGHSQTNGVQRQKEDLEIPDDWVLCNLMDLTDIVEIDLANDLEQARVSNPEQKKTVCSDLMRSMSRLRSKQQDLQVILARLDPNQAEMYQNLPLSPEQAAQQNELRREFAKFTQKLAEVEEALTLLKTRIATTSQASGKGKGASAQVPTVEAVMRTIGKMTTMAEKRSGDVDVLETQMRQLRLASVSASASVTPSRDLVLAANAGPSTPRTPQRYSKRASLFSPDRSMAGSASTMLFSPATPRAGYSSLLANSNGPFRASVSMTPVRDLALTPVAMASPVRRKLSGFSKEEKVQLMSKRARKKAVLGKLKAQVQEKGVTVWEMETVE
ncbi:Nucleoporin NUP159 [Ceratocystis fimbriata CBS 114723]|uniref:Nucleoporin NUP159 n=1 Tax=Ceratocystis fimbriata CBS 114723 TaxID=1035309 RepID=A0A2C5X474_9PEZI|nr:Nucleoporin NUP159 [Ceratocystis fimbriata CBS 114723]